MKAEPLLGLMSELNKKTQVSCLAEHLVLVELKINVAFYCYY